MAFLNLQGFILLAKPVLENCNSLAFTWLDPIYMELNREKWLWKEDNRGKKIQNLFLSHGRGRFVKKKKKKKSND